MNAAAGLTLDAGALIALERNDEATWKLMVTARKEDLGVAIPAGVLAQVWRGGARQARLAAFLNTRGPGSPTVHPMTDKVARSVGLICAISGSKDVVDASVAVCARALNHVVVTSDPDDLRAIDPGVRVIVV